MDKLVFSVREMADKLGVSMPTAYALTERQGFPVVKVGNKKIIPIKDLEAWLSKEAGA